MGIQVKQKPVAFRLDWPAEYSMGLQRFFANDDSPRMNRMIEFAPEGMKPKIIPLYEEDVQTS